MDQLLNELVKLTERVFKHHKYKVPLKYKGKKIATYKWMLSRLNQYYDSQERKQYDVTVEFTYEIEAGSRRTGSYQRYYNALTTYTLTQNVNPLNQMDDTKEQLKTLITNDSTYAWGGYQPENINIRRVVVVPHDSQTLEQARKRLIANPMHFAILNYDNKGIQDPREQQQNQTCVLDILMKNYNYTEEFLTKHFTGKGVSCEELADFCQTNSISMYATDLHYNILVNVVPEVRDHHKTALMFITANGHIYEIIDKKLRRSIQNKAAERTKFILNTQTLKEEKKPLLKKENRPKPLTLTDYAVDTREIQEIQDYAVDYAVENQFSFMHVSETLAYELESLPNNKTYYLTDDKADLLKIFYYIVKTDHTIPKNKEISGKMTHVLWARKNIQFYYNVHIDDVLHVCKELDKSFYNQSLGSLARAFLTENKYDINCVLSTYNSQTRDIFTSELAKSSPTIHNFESKTEEELTNTRVVSYDIAKCYSHILQTYPLPKYNVFSSVAEFKPTDNIEIGYYFITTEAHAPTPFRGNGWYFSTVVSYGLQNNIVTKDQIKFTLLAAAAVDDMNSLIPKLYKKHPSIAKIIANCIVGSIGMKDGVYHESTYVNNIMEAAYYRFLNNSQVMPLTNALYKVLQQKKVMFHLNGKPAHMAVIQTGNVLVHQLYKLACETMPTAVCMSIKVDAVHFRLSKKKIKLFTAKTKLKAKIGEYRKETPLSSTIHETTPLIRNHEYEPMHTRTNIETLGQWDVKTIGRQVLENHPNGCLIQGDAGTGKSVILMQIYEELKKGTLSTALLAPTNIAAVRIKGQTIHKFLRCNNDGCSLHGEHLMNIIRKYKYILIDEISMVNTQLYEYLALLRSQGIIFYISGDFKQIRPVKEEHIDFENSIVLNDLTPDRIQLTHNYRANQSFADACALQSYDMNMFRSGDQESNASYDKLNICYTHEMRNKINAKCEKIYGKLGELGSYIIMKESTRTIGKNLIPKNIIFEVTGPREVTQRFTDEETKFTFTKDEFKDLISTCELAYAVTCHSIQGATIKTPYTIHQYDIFNKNMIYTALTRTTDPNNVRILP